MPWAHIFQVLATIAMVAPLAYLHPRSRALALAFVWLVWLVTPLIRRLISVLVGATDLDVLALAPFAVTALAAALELRLVRLDRRAVAVLGVAALGFLIGIIEGLAHPFALGFALVAYGGAFAAAVLGYSEHRRSQLPSLFRVLLVIGPLIALYGVAQYVLLPYMPWDDAWVERSGLASIGAPGLPDQIRVFGTLNAPAVYAVVLAVAALVLLTTKRLGPAWILAAAAVAAALALTYVRSAWVALVAASIVLVLFSLRRDIAARTVLTAGTIVLVVAVGVAFASPTANAIADRALTLQALEEDVSARERMELVEVTVQDIVAEGGSAARRGAFGHGLGQAGVATRLGERTPLSNADNGYLALLYQVGPFGAVLVLLPLGAVTLLGLRRAVAHRHDAARRTNMALLLSVLGALLLLHWFMDALHGVVGAMLWYVSGHILASANTGKEQEVPVTARDS